MRQVSATRRAMWTAPRWIDPRPAAGWLGSALCILTTVSLPAQTSAPPDTVVTLPATFAEHRIFVRPVTESGDTVVFYTDTGGGANMLCAPAAARLDVPQRSVGQSAVADWPVWRTAAAIPTPSDTNGPLGGQLLVVPCDGQEGMLLGAYGEGFLGRLWFANRVWIFDYDRAQLLLRPAGDLPPHQPQDRIVLGFQTDSSGRRTTHFPRIEVVVAGESFDLLFDTGATMRLTDSALAVIDDGRPALRAASFLSAAVFDRWRTEHPGWRVVERATSFGADLIEVPAIEIAGHRVGPVWFERRNVGVFEDSMSRWMDRPIVGALGGTALRYFRVTVDYNNAIAIFERN